MVQESKQAKIVCCYF